MAHAIRSPEAQYDIDYIAYRIACDKPTAARRWLKELDRTLELLAEFPGLGPQRDDLQPSLRSYPLKAYVILPSDSRWD